MGQDPGVDVRVEVAAVGPFQENAFFLGTSASEEVVLIDPGDEAERLLERVEARGWKPVAIVNTHAHLDHVCAVQPIKERLGIPFHLHPGDLPVLAAAPEHALFFGVRPPAVPEVEHALEDGEVLELAGLRLEVLHTPGHSPGGVCLRVAGHLFAGDTLFAGSIGRTDLPGGDHQTLLSSIRERLLCLPDETVVHCGHGPDTTIGQERISNPFLQEGGAGLF